MKHWLLAGAAALLMGAAAPDYPAMIRALGKTVADNFYDPHLRGLDWSKITRDYEKRARVVRDDAGFERLAGEMMRTLKASHSDISAPASAGRRAEPAMRVEDGVIIDVGLLSDARVKGLRPGFRVLDTAALAGPLGSTAELKVRDCAGAERAVTARREGGYWAPPEPSWRWLRLRQGPGKAIGYLEVNAFGDDGAELADQAMAALGKTDGLIIDLRANQGGNASAVRLASYFAGAPAPAAILLGRDWLKKLGHMPSPAEALAVARVERTYTTEKVWGALQANDGAIAIWSEDLGDKAYRKPVAILIGPETASAAEGFAWMMKHRSKATFIGRRTAAALLSADRLEFAPGWEVRVPMAGVWGPDGGDYGDRALDPDVKVPVDTAALCEGRDLELERALALVSGEQVAERQR